MSLEMKTFTGVFQSIFKDHIATQLFLLAAAVCAINLILSWAGLFTLLIFFSATSLSIFILQNIEARKRVQNALASVLGVKLDNANKPPDEDEKVHVDLDDAIGSFLSKIIKNFISSWYSNFSRDENFVWNLKQELTEAVRQLAVRVRNVDHAKLLSNKLLPIVYSHLDILSRINNAENSSQAVEAFIENKNPIHPATHCRKAEIDYLRHLSKRLLSFVISRSNYESKVIVDLLQEVLTCTVLLPLMDVISDPATINHLVILATNPKVQKITMKKPNEKKVVLLENFTKHFEMRLVDENADDLNGNFLKDQEKLYSFMQHLKSKSADIELLKFYLDVEHLNAQLENSNVITNPYKLSELQQKSEKLLIFYQDYLFRDESLEKKPNDLLEAHSQAQQKLEMKWKNDFYKSAEYFQLIYGDKENTDKVIKPNDFSIPQQKFSSKLKNVMTIRTGTVEGIEATEIPIWDALDHPLGQSSYYNSVSVKLRKERGQDLDNFMQSFFHSIEQEADIGEDIASTQTREDESRNRRIPNLFGNIELYKNLFNIPEHSKVSQYAVDSHVKTAVDSAIFFLDSILNVHKIFLRVASGILKFLPDADNFIYELIRNFLDKIINQEILATLIHDLEEKVFDSKPSTPASKEELLERQKLATTRIKIVNRNLDKTLSHLQNPVLNKNLMYSLIDLIVNELFPELNVFVKD